jgi:hypothetical protein
MARGLALAFLVGLADVGWVIATLEPSDPAAVAALLFGIGLMTFAVASATLYFLPLRLRTRRRPRPGPALRRGALLGTAIASLAFLRTLDALSAVTAAFVLAAFAALEGLLSARS